MKLIGGSKTLRPPPPPRPVIMALLDLSSRRSLSDVMRVEEGLIATVDSLWTGVVSFRVGNGGLDARRRLEAQMLFRRAVVATQVWVACRSGRR